MSSRIVWMLSGFCKTANLLLNFHHGPWLHLIAAIEKIIRLMITNTISQNMAAVLQYYVNIGWSFNKEAWITILEARNRSIFH